MTGFGILVIGLGFLIRIAIPFGLLLLWGSLYERQQKTIIQG